jgi:hypothetical protein
MHRTMRIFFFIDDSQTYIKKEKGKKKVVESFAISLFHQTPSYRFFVILKKLPWGKIQANFTRTTQIDLDGQARLIAVLCVRLHCVETELASRPPKPVP